MMKSARSEDRDVRRHPHPAKCRTGGEAWWYEDDRGIDVVVSVDGHSSIARILWKDLSAALKRVNRARPR